MRLIWRLMLVALLLGLALSFKPTFARTTSGKQHATRIVTSGHPGKATSPAHARSTPRRAQAPHARTARHVVARKHPVLPALRVTRHDATVASRPTAQPDQSPKRVTNRPLIVIDPGHGGRDPGAIGVSGTQEKAVTLATALELRRALTATGRYRVVLTRTTDRTVSLAKRLAFARERDADLLIAIHADASRDRHARGASVYISSRGVTTRLPASPNRSGLIARTLSASEPEPAESSAWLQYSMIEQLADDVRMVTEPARAARLYVLGRQTLPSVLLEMGFLSNRRDEALLRQPAHRGVLVRAIRDAINDYFEAIRAPSSRT